MVWFRLHPGPSAGISLRPMTGNLCGRIRDLLPGQNLAKQALDHDPDHIFRREMKRVFPEADLVELPFDFPI